VSGENVTVVSAPGYWKKQAEEKFDDVRRVASWQIAQIGMIIGSHNYDAKVLDMFCGLGAMVQMMRDGGFKEVYGIDPEPAVSEFWDDKTCLDIVNPFDTGLADSSFDLVTCFGGFGRIDKDKYSKLLQEMKRLTTKTIMFKPYDDTGFDAKKDIIPLLLGKRLIITNINPVLGYYTLEKE